MAVGYAEFVIDYERWWPACVHLYGQRKGQALFNSLLKHNERLADAICGGPMDPFGIPNPSQEVFDYLQEHWGDYGPDGMVDPVYPQSRLW